MIRSIPPYPPYLNNAIFRLGASIAEPFYRTGTAIRNKTFAAGWRKVHRAHVPVISIGNLTTGGTGKTPMVVYAVHTLQACGCKPAVIMRGYHRDPAGRSDEQELMRELMPSVPVIADPDRLAAAQRVASDHSDVNVILMDDGFQHRRMARNLDIVLMDATNPFGYEHVLPRGLMRESASNLRRADAVVLTRADIVEPDRLQALDNQITHLHGRPPIAHAAHTWGNIVDQANQSVRQHKARVFMVIGIGNPDAFADQAAGHYTIVGAKILADHAEYNRAVVKDIGEQLKQLDVDAVLTSEKDWVKLRHVIQSRPWPVPVWRPHMWMGFLRGEKAFNRLLMSTVTLQAEPSDALENETSD